MRSSTTRDERRPEEASGLSDDRSKPSFGKRRFVWPVSLPERADGGEKPPVRAPRNVSPPLP